MSQEWQWSDQDAKESTVVEAVEAIAVYTNVRGEVVIRQQSSTQEDDQTIHIPRAYVNRVIKAMREEAKKPFVPDPE